MSNHIWDPSASRYFSDNYLVLDFEIDTSHGDYGHPAHLSNQMLLACWQYAGERHSIWGRELDLAPLFRDLDRCDFLVAHNAKYELGWLRRSGYDISKILVFDTKLAEYVLFGNVKGDTSLNACAMRRGLPEKDPVVDLLMSRKVNPVEIPRKWLEGRCHKDVADTETVFLSQRSELDKRRQLNVLYTRCIFTPVLADTEFKGMMLDKDRVMAEFNRVSQLEIDLGERVRAMSGEVNLNSGKQLAEFLYDTLKFDELTNRRGQPKRTGGGARATDQDTILKLNAKTAEQKEFKEVYGLWIKTSTALSKYLEFYRAVIENHGGVFHAEFNQTVTATHRLSSSGMKIEVTDRFGKTSARGTQFQNQPREYKRLFKARKEGWYFTEWDGSGLEFRVAGIVGNDTQIQSDINNPDFDPHTRTASVIFDRDYDDLRDLLAQGDKEAKELRTRAKAFTFKPLFGGERGTRSEVKYYESFKQRYNKLTATQSGWLKEAFNTGVVKTNWGMRYYFPNLKVTQSGYIEGKTNVFNYPIQGFATAEVIPIAATYFWHLVAKAGLSDRIIMVNTVHDSVLAEVAPEALDDYKRIVIECWRWVYFYLEVMYNQRIDSMPFGTEITYGTHWGEGTSETFNIWSSGEVING